MPWRYEKAPNPESSQATDDIRERVTTMLRDLEQGGIDALRRWSRELDDWDPDSFVVSDREVGASAELLERGLRGHIAAAQDRVRRFAEAQRSTLVDLEIELEPGVVLGHQHIPVASVGAYVPGGRYPMLASSFMTILVAKEAGVGQVVGCAPPRGGAGIHPAMLYAMHTSGADVILALGGVQALAAMAFGMIDGVAPVDMLVGAGNAYVAEAKRQLFGGVGIDLLAGPTEVLVIVAAVSEQIAELLKELPTAEVAGVAWRDHGWIAVADDDESAIELANEAANEHLEVQVDERKLAVYFSGLRNYGSLFLGEEATVAYGDKGVGTNHVLPTSLAARYTGGLWVGKFLKTCTYQRLTQEGTRRVGPSVEAISLAENFAGHAADRDNASR